MNMGIYIWHGLIYMILIELTNIGVFALGQEVIIFYIALSIPLIYIILAYNLNQKEFNGWFIGNTLICMLHLVLETLLKIPSGWIDTSQYGLMYGLGYIVEYIYIIPYLTFIYIILAGLKSVINKINKNRGRE